MSIVKIIVIGDGSVGKTALTIQLTSNHFVTDYDPTIENTYRKLINVGDIEQMTEILDTAGQEEYGGMRESYYRMGDGFVIVFSVTQRETMSSVETILGQIYRVKDTTEFPTVVAANKIDLENERKVMSEDIQKLGARLEVPVLEVSAKTRVNVEETFTRVVEMVLKYKSKCDAESNEAYRIKKKKKCCIQ